MWPREHGPISLRRFAEQHRQVKFRLLSDKNGVVRPVASPLSLTMPLILLTCADQQQGLVVLLRAVLADSVDNDLPNG